MDSVMIFGRSRHCSELKFRKLSNCKSLEVIISDSLYGVISQITKSRI